MPCSYKNKEIVDIYYWNFSYYDKFKQNTQKLNTCIPSLFLYSHEKHVNAYYYYYYSIKHR